ncbi:hypothetical protein F66182_14706, partial [Fusarium sp. NRRL 66182]
MMDLLSLEISSGRKHALDIAHLSWPWTLLAAVLILKILHILRVVHQPGLRTLPGHWLASFSRLYKIFLVYDGLCPEKERAMHKKYGPVVRLGPHELSVNSIDGLRTIYTGGFEKTSWYRDIFVNFGTENLVSTLEHKPHSIQKRMLSNVYSKSYLQNSPDLQKVSSIIVADRFLPLLSKLAQSREAINVLPLLQGLGQDFTSAYLFGSKYGTDFIHDVAKRDHWLD